MMVNIIMVNTTVIVDTMSEETHKLVVCGYQLVTYDTRRRPIHTGDLIHFLSKNGSGQEKKCGERLKLYEN